MGESGGLGLQFCSIITFQFSWRSKDWPIIRKVWRVFITYWEVWGWLWCQSKARCITQRQKVWAVSLCGYFLWERFWKILVTPLCFIVPEFSGLSSGFQRYNSSPTWCSIFVMVHIYWEQIPTSGWQLKINEPCEHSRNSCSWFSRKHHLAPWSASASLLALLGSPWLFACRAETSGDMPQNDACS